MTHVLEICDPENYVDAKGQSEWEKAMLIEMDSLWIITLGIYFLDRKERTLWNVNGFIRPNLPLKVLLSVIRLLWSQKDSLNRKESTILRPFPELKIWTMFNLFSLLLLTSDDRSIIWMLRTPFYMVTYLKRFTWNNLLILWRILTLFVN